MILLAATSRYKILFETQHLYDLVYDDIGTTAYILALEEQINVRVFIQAQQDPNSSTLTQVNYQYHLTESIGNLRSRSKKKDTRRNRAC